MPQVDSATLDNFNYPWGEQLYCGLDTSITLEVWEELQPNVRAALAREQARRATSLPGVNVLPSHVIYDFERALQAPAMEMMLRGFKVNERARREAVAVLDIDITRLQRNLDLMAHAVWNRGLNANSSQQLQNFFYECMGIPKIWISQKGVRKLSMNREVLEKLEVYFYAKPIVGTILAIRDLLKQKQVLETEVDPDGRMRTSYNIAGTECLSGDALVWTISGLQRIDKIYQASKLPKVWNGKEYVKPVRKVKYENREGFHIELTGGYVIRCSANHPIMTQRGFVEAAEITLLDKIELNIGIPELSGQYIAPWGMLNEDFCEWYGMMLADGSVNNTSEHYRCRLSNSNRQILARFAELSEKEWPGTVVGFSGDEAYFSGKKAAYRMDILLDFPADAGLGAATQKIIHSCVMQSKPNLMRATLRGLTLDTHITEKGLMFGTQSRMMQEQIQQMLLFLGIQTVKLEVGDGIKLCVPNKSCGRFLYLIGFVEEEKAGKLARQLNLRSQKHEALPHYTKQLVAIKSKKAWRGDVYDLTMPMNSPPQYVAQGMTVHNTGRWSSSGSSEGTGGNLQNITPRLRYVFEADPGWKLCAIDLEQAESREVGWLCGILFDDWSYLDGCYSGDLHTTTCRLIWPDRPWTGDLKTDKALAEENFYRSYSYRDMSKRGGHGSNYLGTPPTMARHLKVSKKLMVDFQGAYFGAFPGIPKWHQWVASEIQTKHSLTTVFGRTREFFGRATDDTTLREAVAFGPQSATGDRMNLILWRLWKYMGDRIRLMAQVHDAVYFLYREDDNEVDVISTALSHFDIDIRHHSGRQLIVGGEAKVGWNWGSQEPAHTNKKTGLLVPEKNPNGLMKFKGSDSRKRIADPSILSTVL